jgi:hypothetical protein
VSCCVFLIRSFGREIGVCWCVLVFVGVCWCLLVCVGVCWCLLVFIERLAFIGTTLHLLDTWSRFEARMLSTCSYL